MDGSLPPVTVPRVLRTRLSVDPARSCAEHEQAAQVDDTGGSSALSGGAILRKAQRVLGAMNVDLVADFSPRARVMNLRKMDDLAQKYQTTVSAIALAWLRAQPSVAAPIASARTLEQLKEIMPVVELSTEELWTLTNS